MSRPTLVPLTSTVLLSSADTVMVLSAIALSACLRSQ
jgi:hypothetical protein